MGTSSMYTGPSNNPLLPSNFEDSLSPGKDLDLDAKVTDDGHQDDTTDSSFTNGENQDHLGSYNNNAWREAKSYMSRLASGNSTNYKRAVSSYVKAHGGAKNAAKSATAGVKSTVNFGGFISSSYRNGIRSVLNEYKIEYEGRSARDILTDIINRLAPIPVTKEDSVA